MKKQIFTLALIAISYATIAQTETKQSNLSLIFDAKLGFAKISQEGSVNLNGTINASDILLSYEFSKNLNITTGFGMIEYNANSILAGNATSLKNTYIQIPLRISGDYIIFNNKETKNPNVAFTIGGGFCATNLLKQEIGTISGSSSNNNLGWNFGFLSQFGVKFIISDKLNLGMGLENQTDFTKMKNNGAEQRIERLNALYLKFVIKY